MAEQETGQDPQAAGATRRRWLLIAMAGLGVAAIALGLWFASFAFLTTPAADAELRVVIPHGTGLPGIQRILAKQGVVPQSIRLLVLARLMGVAGRLKAGEYLFTAEQTPVQVLRLLTLGGNVPRPITFPEGVSIRQIAEILANGEWGEKEEILELLRDRDLMERYGAVGESMEGYLFPDTYHLVRGQSPEEIITMLAERGRKVRAELGDLARNELSLSPHQVLTLASIVEKETAVPEERPLIARVFLNRLRLGMRLQTDPTVIYGIPDFNGDLTRRDLETPTPYNTYQIDGLPPGPIANPGKEAIKAVLRPAKSSALFFVAKNDGTHYFSTTLAEHNQAVRRYQLNGRR
ncbi:MAG: endolytic transglycosylase MltG [Thermodesulfobacteriota bacterium]